jgi:hypothetical protein
MGKSVLLEIISGFGVNEQWLRNISTRRATVGNIAEVLACSGGGPRTPYQFVWLKSAEST